MTDSWLSSSASIASAGLSSGLPDAVSNVFLKSAIAFCSDVTVSSES